MDTVLLIITIGEAFVAWYFIWRCSVLKKTIDRYEQVLQTMELTDRTIPKKKRTMWG